MTIIGELFGLRPQPWQNEAVCASTDPEAFFPDPGMSTLAARLVCVSCPVRQRCLSEALANDEIHGVWGGYSFRQRQRIMRGEQVPLAVKPDTGKPPVCIVCGTEFDGHGTSKYCSKYCANYASKQRVRARRTVNADVVTRVSVVRKRDCPENGEGWYVYDWTAWRVDPDNPNSITIYRYANGELAHFYDDGIEELALRVLSAYRRLLIDREVPA